MKKAQLTLMIITGIVFLVAVAIVLYMGSQAATKRTAPEASHQRLRQASLQQVKDFIQACLDVTTMSALDLLGKQGGVLYKSQGGLTPDVSPLTDLGSRYVVYDGLNVSYVITRPVQDIGTVYFAQPDKYPYPYFPYIFNETTKSITNEFYGGYYGKSLLPPLFKPGRDSIQAQLESYIAYNLPRCADWGAFAAKGLVISAGKPNISVMIAENKTQIEAEQFFSVVARWQVNITEPATLANTTIDEFSISYPVHLAKFYLFVQGIVFGEVSDARFDPKSLSSQATPVVVVKDVYTNPYDGSTDDMIIVQDAESQLRGKPLEFRILRQNRHPALVWINQTDLNKYGFYPEFCLDHKESIFLEGSRLTIKWPVTWEAMLSAVDPDEDIVTFRTEPPSPAKLGSSGLKAGDDFLLYVDASDGGKTEDYQILRVHTISCPPG
ncbi:MAG: hypothetical protein QXM31_04140 [Candidatus Woesearchaeota archaeon]